MKKHIYQNILKIFLILSACIFSFTCVYAEETGSITVNTPMEDMEVSLYRVGEFTEQGTFTLTKQYQSYSVSLPVKNGRLQPIHLLNTLSVMVSMLM